MPEPRKWEKRCASCEYGFVAVVVNGMSCDMHCPHCHGTGVVPMTTSEMLEALREYGHWSMFIAAEGFGLIRRPELEDKSDFVVIGRLPDPDDALRAALEATHG